MSCQTDPLALQLLNPRNEGHLYGRGLSYLCPMHLHLEGLATHDPMLCTSCCWTSHRGLPYLWVEESCHPVGLGPPRVEPLEQLVVPLQKSQEPITQRASLPGFLEPIFRDAGIEESIQSINERTAQSNSSCMNKEQSYQDVSVRPMQSLLMSFRNHSDAQIPRLVMTWSTYRPGHWSGCSLGRKLDQPNVAPIETGLWQGKCFITGRLSQKLWPANASSTAYLPC